MRMNRKGEMKTLDEDIVHLWKKHGWKVEEIMIPKGSKEWIIKARPNKKKVFKL